jgi:hypothetical protein
MDFDGLFAYVKVSRDAFVAFTRHNQIQDLALARGE